MLLMSPKTLSKGDLGGLCKVCRTLAAELMEEYMYIKMTLPSESLRGSSPRVDVFGLYC